VLSAYVLQNFVSGLYFSQGFGPLFSGYIAKMQLLSLTPLVLPLVFSTGCLAQSGEQEILYGEESDSSCHNAVCLPFQSPIPPLSRQDLIKYQCTALKSILGPQTYYANTPDSVPAPDLKSSFFAIQQQEIIPACWFTPTSAHDVSVALNILREHSCHFAVKSGGHAPNERTSSAEGGVTIDMRLFDAVEYLGDDGEGEVTRVGTGGRWGDVYRALEPLGKTVVGGRDQRVGVGGFMLGGNSPQFPL
jgi:FAD binding domain